MQQQNPQGGPADRPGAQPIPDVLFMPSNDQPTYDFFVSYARKDNETGWITRFVKKLLAEHKRFSAGHKLKPFFDKHEITTGADWEHYLANGVAHSRLFLAFISPNYLASEWCRKEWRAWLDAEIAQHILTAGVRPIYIVKVQGLTGQDQLTDQQLTEELARLSPLTGLDRARLVAETPAVLKNLRRRQLAPNEPFCDVESFYQAGLAALRRASLRRVLKDLAQNLEHHADLVRRANASLSTVPPYNRNFTGRIEELLALRAQLIKDDRTGLIYGIHGLGGMGKSELAFTYAHAFASAYPGGRFLVRCEGKATLRDAVLGQDDLTALFRDRISDEERRQPDSYFAAVVACLRERLDRLGHILLVLDNVTDPGLLVRRQTDLLTMLGPNLHLLATTRLVRPEGGLDNWLCLGQLPDADALDLLEKHRPFASDAEREAARHIVQRLGGFTLAVELVAAHLQAHHGVTCAQLADTIGLRDLEDPRVLALGGPTLRYDHKDCRLSAVLASTFAALSPAERRAVDYAAFLPPDQVALPWLRTLVVADFPEIGQPAPMLNPWDDLWQRLEKLALFTRPKSEDRKTMPRLLRVHRLVQELVREKLPGTEALERQQAVDALVHERVPALAQSAFCRDNCWELEALEALAYQWAERNHTQANWLLNQAGQRYLEFSKLPQAALLLERAIDRASSEDPPNYAQACRYRMNLAAVRGAQGESAQAEALYAQAFQQAQLHLGREDLDTLKCGNGLAEMRRSLGRYAEAETLCRQVMESRQRLQTEEPVDFTTSVHEYARILDALARHEEAEARYRQALAGYERVLGERDPQTLGCMCDLAGFISDRCERQLEAMDLYQRALALSARELEEGAPYALTIANNAAVLLLAQKSYPEAEALFQRVWKGRSLSLGEAHPESRGALYNLSMAMKGAGHYQEAAPLAVRYLELVLAEKATTLKSGELNLAVVQLTGILRLMGQTSEAIYAQLNALGGPFGVSVTAPLPKTDSGSDGCS